MELKKGYAHSNEFNILIFIYIITFKCHDCTTRDTSHASRHQGKIEEQVQGKADLMENSKQLQDDQDSVNQEPQKVEQEQGDANIEDFDQFARQSEHQVDLVEMPLPHNPITSSAIKSIVPVVSQEDQVIKVPHIDFIFGDQQWIVNVHELLV
eukprot:TRINITY_DN10042_c0_g1_i7.p1 TRINITY_DN10042_c0_g1~~TRINITY_DN10042_c0_g1_i7.p1  ORF type:complete len:153 (-),score=31.92 TRINITY_DN10042_c0_g1_i7:363-821(-)